MKEIDVHNWKRRKHFEFFNALDYPHFNITANLQIQRLYRVVKPAGLSMFRAVLFLAVKTANEIPEFRQRIRGKTVVEHESVHPSYTSMTDAEVFSFTDVRYDPDPRMFWQLTDAKEQEVKSEASLEDDPHRDDYLFITSIPWVHFTSFVHPIHMRVVDSVPRLSWGKYLWQGEQLLLPFSVQAHHALVDGQHTGQYFQLLQQYCDEAEKHLALLLG